MLISLSNAHESKEIGLLVTGGIWNWLNRSGRNEGTVSLFNFSDNLAYLMNHLQTFRVLAT